MQKGHGEDGEEAQSRCGSENTVADTDSAIQAGEVPAAFRATAAAVGRSALQVTARPNAQGKMAPVAPPVPEPVGEVADGGGDANCGGRGARGKRGGRGRGGRGRGRGKAAGQDGVRQLAEHKSEESASSLNLLEECGLPEATPGKGTPVKAAGAAKEEKVKVKKERKTPKKRGNEEAAMDQPVESPEKVAKQEQENEDMNWREKANHQRKCKGARECVEKVATFLGDFTDEKYARMQPNTALTLTNKLGDIAEIRETYQDDDSLMPDFVKQFDQVSRECKHVSLLLNASLNCLLYTSPSPRD